MVGYVNQNNLKVIIAYKQYTLFDPIFNTILQYSNDCHIYPLPSFLTTCCHMLMHISNQMFS